LANVAGATASVGRVATFTVAVCLLTGPQTFDVEFRFGSQAAVRFARFRQRLARTKSPRRKLFSLGQDKRVSRGPPAPRG